MRLFTRCAGSRNLHSFPTRRSSDLQGEPGIGKSALLERARQQATAIGAQTLTAVGVESEAERSEEHTSELQSQFHLVCRLLLEKKNKENHSVNCPPTCLPRED